MVYRIGCDVGGTNTDAAILDLDKLDTPVASVLATCKTATTANVTDGIALAIEDVLTKSNVDRGKVLNIAIGTTHFVNAVVESDERHLRRVACVRLCGPYTRENPPFSDYPWALREIVEGPIYYLEGGLEIDGREITPLNADQIRHTALSIREAGITTVAVVGVFSALDHQGLHEERCKQLMLEVCPDLSIVCSRSIGGPGLLVRENATILNAAILAFARKTIAGFRQAVLNLGLRCPLYLTQNDGTLMEASIAAELPIKTFASGPTNSLMGAAFLQQLGLSHKSDGRQLLVVDVGGTTTDICALLPSGFPRKAPNFVQVGGVRTAFSMPEVFSIGLGGGSRVRVHDHDRVTVGPDSVALKLTSEAMVFGGETMTATDVIVADGAVSIGNSENVKSIPRDVVKQARQEIRFTLTRAIDRMKVSNAPVVVILVGGGSIIVGDSLEGVVECLRPPHHDSANAVGAAIAKVAGEIDTIEILENRDEREALEAVKTAAYNTATSNGADPSKTDVVEVTKLPLQYVTNKATRFIVKAVGPLRSAGILTPNSDRSSNSNPASLEVSHVPAETELYRSKQLPLGSLATPTLGVDLTTYTPTIRDGTWHLTPIDVELISVGCGILGTGGGGSPYNESLYVFSLLHQDLNQSIRVVPHGSLADSDVCVFGSGFGAPSVSCERVDSGTHIFAAIDNLNKIMNIPEFQGIVAVEIGGGNGLVAFPSAAHYGRPVIDCDLMGRAFPTVEHCTPYAYGQPLTPASIADTKGNVSIVLSAESYGKVEGMLRTTCIELGNHVAVAGRPLTGDVIKQYAVPNTVSQAWFLGRAVRIAQRMKIDFVKALQQVMPIKMIYAGKVIDVERDVSRGYTVGKCVIAPLSEHEIDIGSDAQGAESRNLVIPFQNEYLAAYLTEDESADGDKEFVCTVPDLISVLGQDGEAIGSPELRYGLQVKVIAMPAHPLWTTKQGLRVGGPDFFGLGTSWVSIGEYEQPRSVFEVYGNGEML